MRMPKTRGCPYHCDGISWENGELIAESITAVASPQASFGVRLSRTHFSPTNEPQRTSAGRLSQRLVGLACSERSDSGERCGVKKAMKSRGGLGREVPSLTSDLLPPRFYFFALLFTSHRFPLSERLEQATAGSAYQLLISEPERESNS